MAQVYCNFGAIDTKYNTEGVKLKKRHDFSLTCDGERPAQGDMSDEADKTDTGNLVVSGRCM